MSQNKKSFQKIFVEFLKHNYIFIIMLALIILRIGLGYIIGAWYGTDQLCDDLAMFNGLSLKRLTSPNELSLIKDLSFSLFLGLSAITGLPYTVFLSLFWVLTAFVVWLAAGKVTKSKWLRLFAFVYVLFLPTAFEAWGGLKIYRNSIFVPCIILTFSLALMLLIDLIKKKKTKKTIWTAIFTGLSFAFTYHLQEGAAWLKVCMLVILLVCFIVIAYRLFKQKAKGKFEFKKALTWSAICLTPFIVLFIWTNAYKGFNHAFFGVYETNTRTNGELAKYVETTYVVDSPNRNMIVWSPYDAIKATFEASPTLGSHPELLEEIRTTAWYDGDIEKHPIQREFLGWVIRTELREVGLWTSEEDISNMFKQVNLELAEALKNGALKKVEGRAQPIKSAYPYTWEDIVNWNFPGQILASLKDAVWLKDYTIGFDYSSNDKNPAIESKVLHMVNDVNVPTGKKRELGKLGANIIAWIYRVMNTVLIVGGLGFIIVQIIKLFKNWQTRKKYLKENRLTLSLALTSLLFFGAAVLYSFGISWFFTEEFSRQIFIFYHIGTSGFLTLAYIPAVISIVETIKKYKHTKRKNRR